MLRCADSSVRTIAQTRTHAGRLYDPLASCDAAEAAPCLILLQKISFGTRAQTGSWVGSQANSDNRDGEAARRPGSYLLFLARPESAHCECTGISPIRERDTGTVIVPCCVCGRRFCLVAKSSASVRRRERESRCENSMRFCGRVTAVLVAARQSQRV